MPGVKPTNEELRERIEFVTECLAKMLHMSQLKAAVREKYGADLSHQTIIRYVSRAREEMLRVAKIPRDEMIAQITGSYASLIRTAPPQAKCRALEGIREMFGLDAPKRTEITGADGTPLIPLEAEEALRRCFPDEVPALLNGNGEAPGRPGNGSETA